MRRSHEHIVRVFPPRIVKHEGTVYEVVYAGSFKHATVYDRGPRGKGTLRRVRNPMLCRLLIDMAFPPKAKVEAYEGPSSNSAAEGGQLADGSGMDPDVDRPDHPSVAEETQFEGYVRAAEALNQNQEGEVDDRSEPATRGDSPSAPVEQPQ